MYTKYTSHCHPPQMFSHQLLYLTLYVSHSSPPTFLLFLILPLKRHALEINWQLLLQWRDRKHTKTTTPWSKMPRSKLRDENKYVGRDKTRTCTSLLSSRSVCVCVCVCVCVGSLLYIISFSIRTSACVQMIFFFFSCWCVDACLHSLVYAWIS